MAIAEPAGATRLWRAAARPALTAAVFAAALAIRFAAAPGADLDPSTAEILGRAPRLDAYWYTRAAVDGARGGAPATSLGAFDRPLYTGWCRAIFAVIGTSAAALPVPSILAAALAAALLIPLGRLGGLGGAALLAGVFAATNWIAVLHDREPLIYSTVNLAFLICLLAWVRGLRSPLWFVPAWAGIVATAVWGKETVLLAVPAMLIVHMLFVDRRRRWALAAGITIATSAAAAAAWLAFPVESAMFVRKLALRLAWTEIPFPGGWIAAIGELPKTLAVIDRVPAIAGLAAVGAVAALLVRPSPCDRDTAAFRQLLVLWLASGCLIIAGFSYRPTRYVLSLFPPAFLLAAYGLEVLWGRRETAVRRGRGRAVAVLAAVWWIGIGMLISWLLQLIPEAVRQGIPAPFLQPPVRLGVAAAAATAIALAQAARLTARGTFAPARRWAVALAAFVLVTDARGLWAHVHSLSRDDLAARRTFEAAVGAGALVAGYGAHYLAFDPRYRVATDFRITPRTILANRSASTHLVTLWVPELRYVERLLAEGGSPLHHVIDVVIARERYRVYRLPDAEARGYQRTPFERARDLEAAGDETGAAAAYREMVSAAPAPDPGILACAGAAMARVRPGEGLRLLDRARAAAPRNGLVALALADVAASLGDDEQALIARTRAAALLPHELVLGFGRPALPAPR